MGIAVLCHVALQYFDAHFARLGPFANPQQTHYQQCRKHKSKAAIKHFPHVGPGILHFQIGRLGLIVAVIVVRIHTGHHVCSLNHPY